jgi:hypothetical protein
VLERNQSEVYKTLTESINEFTTDLSGNTTGLEMKKNLVRNYENPYLYSGEFIEIDY